MLSVVITVQKGWLISSLPIFFCPFDFLATAIRVLRVGGFFFQAAFEFAFPIFLMTPFFRAPLNTSIIPLTAQS